MTQRSGSAATGRETGGSERLHEDALAVFPGGVSHNIRATAPYPLYVERARDSRVWDVDGNEYVDFWMNHMASVLGHSYPAVAEAVAEQAHNGLHYGMLNERALELGRRVTETVPSAERVRYCASGTEATMYAIRLARAATGRDHVLKAQGGWHGGNTDLTKAIHAPFDAPESAGLVPGAADHVHAFPINDPDTVESLFAEYADDVAAVIVEPVLLAGGGIRCTDDFLAFLREITADQDAILIFDEVVTGFRVSPGCWQARIDVTPDLTTLGKFLGGGLPIGALCGRADLFEPARPDVDHPPNERVIAGGGTFTANPMTATAGLASLDVVESEPVYEYTEAEGERVRSGLADRFADHGVEATVLGESSLFCPHFAPDRPLTDVAAVETGTDRDALRAFHRRLMDHGFYFLPGHVGGVSFQTTEDQLDAFLEAADVVTGELIAEGWL